MTRLAHPPLIEAIVEVRWGLAKKDANEVHLNFTDEEFKFFPGEFKSVATRAGYGFMEKLPTPTLPHIVNYRFRKGQTEWPCFQIGTGIFTANQISEGYDWDTFKPAVLDGVKILDESLPKSLKSIHPLYIELRYQDGFYLEQNETSSQFLKTKLNFGFDPPDEFIKSPYLDPKVFGHTISFQLETIIPKGIIVFVVKEAIINGRSGLVMETIMRSEPTKISIKWLTDWLEEAHTTQRHAFNTLINPAYKKAFE